MSFVVLSRRLVWVGLVVTTGAITTVSGSSGCGDPPPGRTYYERAIEPILVQRCGGNTSGCHAVNVDDPYQFAAGNLDVMSFENLQKRRDVLEPFGAYQYPLLLVKAVGPGALPFSYGDKTLDLDVVHAGGALLDVGSDAFLTLLAWLDNGATENGLLPPSPSIAGEGECSTTLPTDFVAAPYLANPQFATFVDKVQPLLASCGAANCHGAPSSDFYVTCGTTDEQRAFNFSRAWAFVQPTVDESQILQVPLAVGAGGGPHYGGDQYDSRESSDYLTIRAWAEAVGPITFGDGDPAKEFFAENVQPALLTRGCAFQGCHSPQSTNDFKFRSGSRGAFSAVSTAHNYQLLFDDFLALEYPDSRRGRAVAKTISPDVYGIKHRGGTILESAGAGASDPANCPPVYDPTTATRFCTVQRWIDLERAPLLAAGEVTPMDPGDLVPIVYIDRAATHVTGPLEFDIYQPGSDLRVADATLGAAQAISSVGASRSLLDNCAGAVVATADVRTPDVMLDGETVAFAMRTSAADPLGLWAVQIDGSNCRRLTPAVPDQNGMKIHNFSPAWSPDGEFLVFASTRGTAGPTRSRKLFLPQSDIWRMRPDGSGLEQLTYLTNSEISPKFIREGRVIMTTEKVSDNFYQLSGRRLNWDRTDYHPLVAQRATSAYADLNDLSATRPSADYAQATDIREAANGDFLVILSDAGARGGAGTLAVFNRSVGTFEAGRRADSPGFMESLEIVDRAATGRVGSSTAGAYRSPYSLPDGNIMVSRTNYTGDLATATSFDWDLVSVDPRTGARQLLIGGPGAQVEAVLAIRLPVRKNYLNRRQLVFGGNASGTDPTRAYIHMPDAPMIFTVLTGNLRRGRPVDDFRRATQLAIYLEQPVPAGTTSGTGPGGIYEMRQLLGRAPLASDGSVRVDVPASKGVILALEDASGATVVTMTEEHQVGPGESITMGIKEDLFDQACGGCHGSVSGSELDISVTPDVLTGASQSLSAKSTPVRIGN